MDREDIDAIITPFLSSDLAGDVRNVYSENAADGPGPAVAVVFETFRDLMGDPNEGPVILLAVAALQVRTGQLLDPIRDAALELIESGQAARAWRPTDGGMNLQRKAALEQLRMLLA